MHFRENCCAEFCAKRYDFRPENTKNRYWRFFMNRKHMRGMRGLSILLAALLLTGCGSTGETPSGNTGATVSVSADTVSETAETDSTADRTEITQLDYTLSDSTADIYVEPVSGLSDDFLLGVDISSLISEENSGVTYYNNDGEEQDLLKTLAENGVNAVRLRVWNDPYDADGNSYGGGVCDVDTAIAIGTRATAYGMSVCIDFHYSDFWADPSKQMVPKAWADMELSEKSDALYEFTLDALGRILAAGVNVTIVQLGNETTNGFCGETSWKSICTLMNSGAKAIRELDSEYGTGISIAVHFTNPENTSKYMTFANMLWKYGVDYDIFASSYYPYWHGTTENLTSILTKISEEYDKKVMVAEVSWSYTYENGDDFGNTISEESVVDLPYSVSVQGQADCIRDTVAAVAACGEAGVGCFYWEPAWIPVGTSYDTNLPIWEANGSGWASSYSAEYDPDDAGIWYGGSSWDNQALFDFTGHPLDSLAVFRLMKSGNAVDPSIDMISPITVSVRLNDEVLLPEEVTAKYNDRTESSVKVIWNEDEIRAIDTGILGSSTVTGTVTENGETYTATANVNVVESNYLDNPGFEDEDMSMWTITNIDEKTTELYVINKVSDAVSGDNSLHFYSSDPDGVEFRIEQTVTGLSADNTYHCTMTIHGGDCGDYEMYLYAIVDGVTYTADTGVSSWRSFETPEITGLCPSDGTITVGAYIKASVGGWGNLDDFLLAPED